MFAIEIRLRPAARQLLATRGVLAQISVRCPHSLPRVIESVPTQFQWETNAILPGMDKAKVLQAAKSELKRHTWGS
jgi:hypothetical protein